MPNFRALCVDLWEAHDRDDQAAIDAAWDAVEAALSQPPSNDICSLGMPKELLFPLLRAGFEKISEIATLGRDGLLRIKRIGPDRAQQIEEYLKCHG